MLERKEIIEDGDWVVLYEGFGSVKSVQVKAGQSYQNRVAHFSHNDIIGKRYGSQVSLHRSIAFQKYAVSINHINFYFMVFLH